MEQSKFIACIPEYNLLQKHSHHSLFSNEDLDGSMETDITNITAQNALHKTQKKHMDSKNNG